MQLIVRLTSSKNSTKNLLNLCAQELPRYKLENLLKQKDVVILLLLSISSEVRNPRLCYEKLTGKLTLKTTKDQVQNNQNRICKFAQ